MKIASWSVNSLKVCLPAVLSWLETNQVDGSLVCRNCIVIVVGANVNDYRSKLVSDAQTIKRRLGK